MSDLINREMVARVDLNEGEIKTIARGLIELLSAIDSSSEVTRDLLEDNKRFLISLTEKMEKLLEGFK